MKKTIGITNINFKDLFTEEELNSARERARSNKREQFAWRFDILILNSGGTDIYLEYGNEASKENGFIFSSGNTLSYEDFEIDKLNLISDGGEGEIRVLMN